MTPTLITLALVVVAVAVIAWVTHRKRAGTTRIDSDQDTAWNDTVHPAPPHEKHPPQ